MENYPLLDLFLTMMYFFLWIMWLFLLFRVVMDIFRDDDLSGWGKAGWLVFCIVLPFLGVLVYVIARGRGMGRRDVKQAKEAEEALQDYIRRTAADARAGTGGPDDLTKLSDLHRAGVLSDDEFNRAKTKLLA
ncbi:SHOCT domain-containing protein [Streptomyces candidus]|uniref:Cytochrome P450 n=1 Tax=Streptomyces candidus TaxID=67283 RepID=A0A7X0LRX1_9ACTN|nr:SHOCT domain-containing protein [Streptomyces candidus]MBB6438600.1 cytochrome P450 [Streptomyces candidus]GHH45365.1 membrane protein [Streptomyces candidus]